MNGSRSFGYAVNRVGPCAGVEEHFFAIGTERKVLHPLVQRLLPLDQRPTGRNIERL